MVDSEGRVQRLLAISRDITESHLHQQEWQDAMAFFADGIVILDLDNRVVRANQPFWLLTGTSPEQGVGRDITTILHPQGGEEICPCCLARSQGEDGLFTLEGDDPVNPCGYPVELMVRMIRDAKGQPLSVLMGFHDLRRQRQAEEELRHHRDHLEELVALRTAELVQKNNDLSQLNKQFVGRELRMIELKKEIARLQRKENDE
jgi:PAS domain S-box-containing protein|nr:PAS domain-containing protein [Desulfobulbaceae bacterium]